MGYLICDIILKGSYPMLAISDDKVWIKEEFIVILGSIEHE